MPAAAREASRYFRGRPRLSARENGDWANAAGTVTAATNRLCSLLIQGAAADNAQEPDENEAAERDQQIARIDRILGRVRDDPLQEQPTLTREGEPDEDAVIVNDLVRLSLELLHAQRDSAAREPLRETCSPCSATTSTSPPTSTPASPDSNSRWPWRHCTIG
jgi:hypothetical protein